MLKHKNWNLTSKKKKILIGTVSAVTAVSLLAGIAVLGKGRSEPVNVYPFQNLGMTEYWGDNQESYGPVSTDKVQTVFLSDTQTVTEIYVEQGDTVKKGDLLMSYDTTLTDITLERKRLSVEMLKLQLKEAQDRLKEIRGMVPMVPADPDDKDEEDVDLGQQLYDSYQIIGDTEYNGNSEKRALICWMQDIAKIDHWLLEELRLAAEEYQTPVVTPSPTPTPTPSASPSPTPTPTPTPSPTPTPMPTLTPDEDSDSESDSGEDSVPVVQLVTEPKRSSLEVLVPIEDSNIDLEPEVTPVPPLIPVPSVTVKDYYVIFKITEEDMSKGTPVLWQGMHVYGDLEEGFYFRFFDAASIPDHTLDTDEEEETPEEEENSGFTSAQLAQMRAEQERRIHDLQLDIRMAEAEYKIMKIELDDGKVYADIDGEAVSVLTEEEAKANAEPLIKISDGGGYYMDGSISELEKDKLQIGQEVKVNDWNTGMEYIGQVQSVGDFPITGDGWTGIGNPNASFYPFRVYIDGEADLQAGRYVNVTYSTSGTENGIYLENPFILTESGSHYVYVMGENGRLEKRAVTVGKSLWGSYKQILNGITEEDLIAFPYGKNIRDGAPAVESDISALYEY